MGSRTILIIEDNESDVVLFRTALNHHGVQHDAVVISDGAEAIEFARSAPRDGKPPSLIILDLNLPRCHGLEVLEAIRESPALIRVPVAVCTTSDSQSERDRAEQIGVQAYLNKPVDFDRFLALGAVLGAICRNPGGNASGAAC